ncbi:VTT domain-containing protein [Candidatus Gottesmanbacteria bacterium]|nr:VTT domain-containing protein [Candidatus Gottesmanbacteria bacterium]
MRRRIQKKKSLIQQWQRIAILLLSLVLMYLLWRERRLIYKFESWGYIGLFLINAFTNATVILPLPSFITVFIGGSIWNPLMVGIISGLGAAIGELIGFFVGFGSRGVIDIFDGQEKWLKKTEKWLKKNGFITIFVTSVLPDPFFDLVGIAAGTLNYPIWKFFLATALGRIFRNIIIAWSGAKIIP